MSDQLRVLADRFRRDHSAAWATRDIPLAEMSTEKRTSVRKAEDAARKLAYEIVPRIRAGELDDPPEITIMYIRLQQMLEELQLIRRSEERCLQYGNDAGLLAAESKYRNALAELHALCDQLEGPAFHHCRYLGGYRYLPKPIDPAVLWFDVNLQTTYISVGGIPESVAIADALPVPWSWINSVAIEGPEEIRRRVTATRAAAGGILALAFKKRIKQTILVLETRYEDAFFEISGYEAVELRAEMSGWQRYFEVAAWVRGYDPMPKQSSATPQPTDPLEQIKKLAELREAGLVSEREFEHKRIELLARV